MNASLIQVCIGRAVIVVVVAGEEELLLKFGHLHSNPPQTVTYDHMQLLLHNGASGATNTSLFPCAEKVVRNNLVPFRNLCKAFVRG